MKSKLALLGTICSFLLLASTVSGCKEQGSSGEQLLIAHTHSTNHPVHKGLVAFKQYLEEHTKYQATIYPNGLLGQNADLIQMVRAGVLDVAKVSASSLEQFNEAYSIFSLPYVFVSEDHYFRTMRESNKVKEIFMSTEDQGFVGIGWYDSGARSIYTTTGKVASPKDLHGLKIRTQDSQTSIKMISYMGGSATPMSGGEVYSALTQRVIDGAENNETVLVDDGHGDVAKHYSYTEHQYTPDIVIMSTKTFKSMSDKDRENVLEAMNYSWEVHEKDWKKIIDRNIKGAIEMGVNFYRIDKTPFIEACKPLQNEFINENPKNKEYFEDFESFIYKEE